VSKTAIAVMSCVPYRDRRDAIDATWFRDVPVGTDFYFFVGTREGDQREDAEVLPCGDEYADCAKKQFEAIRFLLKYGGYDHVFFCDDDTYVVADRLLACGYEAHDYMGCPCLVGEYNIVVAHGGAGFWMSRRAMELADAAPEEDKAVSHFSDRALGYVLDRAGIKVHGDFRFNMGKYNNDVGFCNLVPNRENPYITAHYVRPAMFPALHAHFKDGTPLPPNRYGMNFFGMPVDLYEVGGHWGYSLNGGPVMYVGGGFVLAHDAEAAAFEAVLAGIRRASSPPPTP
jgi:hypothetical protein